MNDKYKLELPTNIKQIGSISEGLKVYMEDYVCTYIQQYAAGSGCEEKIAVLVGKEQVIDGEQILFISGAVAGKYTEYKDNMETLTEQSWIYIQEQIDIYFKGLKVVGWLYVQPGYGDYLNDNHRNYHITFFEEKYQVLFLTDPMDKISSFFAWNNDASGLKALTGYIIYFERNEGMHEYMLNNKVSRISELKEVNSTTEAILGTIDTKFNQARENKRGRKPRTSRIRERAVNEQKKMVNLLGSLSAVLFLVCFIMGAGLIQNDDRISKLEEQLAAIDNSYKFLLSQIKEDKTQSVFAAQQSTELIKENTTVKEEQTTQAITAETTVTQTETVTENTTAEQTTVQVTEEKIQPTTSNVKDENNETTIKPTLNIPDTYTVKEGDNLSFISRKFYGTDKMMDKIMEVNGLDNPNTIYFGKVLKLPKP